jgi:hypothetical protein
MKIYSKYLGLFAATCLAFVGVARAQFVTISDDTNNWSGSVIAFNGTGQNDQAEGEGITGVTALEAVTYTFMSTSAGSATGGSLAATLVQWNGSNYTLVQSLGTVSIPAPDTWSGSLTANSITAVTYQQSFDLSFTNTTPLIAADTYVVLLTNTGAGSLSFGLGLDTLGASGPGTQYLAGGSEQKGNGLATGAGGDWTFSDVTLLPSGNTIPTPEPATVAAIMGAILVAGLVLFRLRQRQGTQAAFATIA